MWGKKAESLDSSGFPARSSPDKVTSNNLNRTPQLEGGRFGLFHFLKYFLRRFLLLWERFSFLFKTLAKSFKLCYNNSATQFNILAV